jgi:phage gp36-like protein
MPYSEPDDLRKQWVPVLTTHLTADEVARLIDDADGIIDSYLARRYAVPVATTPASTPRIIRTISATLALIDVVDKNPATPEWVARKLERAWKLLEAIANGDMTIPGVVELSTSGGIQSSTADYEPTFGSQPSIHEHVDWDRQDAERDARGIPDVCD